ncbi:unnamed protein product [Cochlearia groenlandica]
MSENFTSQLTSVEISANVANKIQNVLTVFLNALTWPTTSNKKIDADGQANAQRIDEESRKTHQRCEDLTARINAISTVREPRHQRRDLSLVQRTQLEFNTPPTGTNNSSLKLGGPNNMTTPSRSLNTTPFANHLVNTPAKNPGKIKLLIYDGLSDPRAHVTAFRIAAGKAQFNEKE